MPSPSELERQQQEQTSRQFEIRHQVGFFIETLTIEARNWDDAVVQARGMVGDAHVVAEIERFIFKKNL